MEAKTNEFLRRRKLRLQQVREQSKDIAKKIRQRAKVEKFKHIVDLDTKKENEYLQRQEKIVKQLEQLYSQGLQNVGAGHTNASEESLIENIPNKIELAKHRGKEAAAILRQKKQEKLDERKRLLDRKLKAREAANDLSRDKSKVTSNQLQLKSTTESSDKKILSNVEEAENKDIKQDNSKAINQELVTKIDMATQWDSNIPNEWEPNIPKLTLPKDVDDTKATDENVNKKKLDLFALSEDMPSSLRIRASNLLPEESLLPFKPSLTLISEYLQHRNLRLREPDTSGPSKKSTDDLRKIKETILKTRASNTSVSARAPALNKNPELNVPSSAENRKSYVPIYNYSTCKVRTPAEENELVVRDTTSSKDAYSRAIKENSVEIINDSTHEKRLQDMRSKIAMTKLNVEKDYKDTMAFLNSLPKNKFTIPNKHAFMDAERQKQKENNRQKKMQQEFKEIERECKKQHCKNYLKSKRIDKTKRTISNSPTNIILEDNHESKSFQYSWMPVPDSDASLAVHTIPTAAKDQKTSHSVKFSQGDSYHEYRSLHKHTPPTKDTGFEKYPCRATHKTVIIENEKDQSSENLSIQSETSSVDMKLKEETRDKMKRYDQTNHEISDTEKIIIYKIIQSKQSKERNKRKTKLKSDIQKSDTGNSEDQKSRKKEVTEHKCMPENICDIATGSFKASEEHFEEGIYKAVNKKGHYCNVKSIHTSNVKYWQSNTEPRPWWDNLTSMYFSDNNQDIPKEKIKDVCRCGSSKGDKEDSANGTGDSDINQAQKRATTQKSGEKIKPQSSDNFVSVTTSDSSFKSAAADKMNTAKLHSDGYVNLVDNAGQESGKFYIGASGFLSDEAYEVVIQLKKRENVKNLEKMPIRKSVDTVQLKSNNRNQKQVPECVDTSLENIVHDLQETNHQKNNKVFSHKKAETDLQIDDPLDMSQLDKSSSRILKQPKKEYIPVTKPSATAYTQTTFDSPLQRPALCHMSSSTSTAYLSPPEIILPKFFKHYKKKIDEKDDKDSQNARVPKITIKCTKHSHCKKKSLVKPAKVIKNKSNYPSTKFSNNFTSSSEQPENLRTPPNTANSCFSNIENNDGANQCLSNVDKRYSSPVKIRCCKCRKCGATKASKNYIKHTAQNIQMCNVKKKNVTTKKEKQQYSKLTPVIKNYVNRLLALSKDSLKAIEIINLECSSVATPGSSIINIDSNLDKNKTVAENTISLNQIKQILQSKIEEHCIKKQNNIAKYAVNFRKRSIHKSKSLNVSKKNVNAFINRKVVTESKSSSFSQTTSSNQEDIEKSKSVQSLHKTSSPKNNNRVKLEMLKSATYDSSSYSSSIKEEKAYKYKKYNKMIIKNNAGARNHEAEVNGQIKSRNQVLPDDITENTEKNIDNDIKLMKDAENKLQNMEKIANLTEKCTQRLSNLSKVLEEVRKNKSSVLSHISTSDKSSDSDQKNNTDIALAQSSPKRVTPITNSGDEDTVINSCNEIYKLHEPEEYMTLLEGIPKPGADPQIIHPKPFNVDKSNGDTKSRGKPPPALLRNNLKTYEGIIPHELSTVVEVDSPMSVKHRSLSVQHCDKSLSLPSTGSPNCEEDSTQFEKKLVHLQPKDIDCSNLDLLQNNGRLAKPLGQNFNLSDKAKMEMLDIKKFNEIMLKPFVSIEEYAKQCKSVTIREGSHLEDNPKEIAFQDDLSSLHSEGSLPDVIGELLKRKIISEPFKFDTPPNVNSTAVSSESSTSILTFSKLNTKRRQSSIVFENKENVAETSDSLSISSNPDLENAFKKFGMAWASSTLKKTKERLALSSSSNTSNSSISQKYKINDYDRHDATDRKISKKSLHHDVKPKNAAQQTSMIQSMTVQEFLDNELAHKITFGNKTRRNDTEQEYISLYETKMPEEMKNASQKLKDDYSIENGGNVNRARTSTPVQIFKSMTYHSSSSSNNVSNGLFSNVDDLSSVKVTSSSMRNHSTSDKDDLTIPNYSLRVKKDVSDRSKSEE